MRISYITRHSPYPLNAGGRIRDNSIFTALGKFANVSLIVLGDKLTASERSAIKQQGILVFSALRENRRGQRLRRVISALVRGEDISIARLVNQKRRLKLQQLVRQHEPDLIIIGHTILAPLASSLGDLGTPMILDTHNVESQLARSICSGIENPLKRWARSAHASYLERLERSWIAEFDAVWAVSEKDADWYLDQSLHRNVHIVPNVIDVDRYPLPKSPQVATIVFVGWYRHWPNVDAATRLIRMSSELEKRGRPHRILLIGRDMPDSLRAVASKHRSVEAVGEVDDVRPYLAESAAVAAPLYAGSGSNLKVIEAMAAGKPVVTTSQGVSGFSGNIRDVALVADNDRDFLDQLQWCVEHPVESSRIGLTARNWVKNRFSQRALNGIVRDAVLKVQKKLLETE